MVSVAKDRAVEYRAFAAHMNGSMVALLLIDLLIVRQMGRFAVHHVGRV